MESIWAPWILGLSFSELGAATTTNIGSMFRRAKFTIYCLLCCANGTPVEATPSMNFGLFAKRKESNTSGAAGHSATGYSNGAQKNASTGNPSSIGSYFQ